MSPAVTAESFWNTFADALRSRLAGCNSWRSLYTHDTEWTKFMTHDFLAKLGETLGFQKVCWEWCRVDVSYFSYPHPADVRSGTMSNDNPGWDWDWEVAIEHENDGRSWLEEFTKLGHINCGLKVLITYHDYSRPLEEKIAEALRLHKGRKYRQAEDRWLLIFGPHNRSLGVRDFVAFGFDGANLVELLPKSVLPQDSP